MKAEVIREIARSNLAKYGLGKEGLLVTHTSEELTIALKTFEQAGFVVLPKEELEAALRPFAKFADAHCDEHEKAMEVGGYVPLDDDYPIEVPFGTVRRAAALLAALTQEGRG